MSKPLIVPGLGELPPADEDFEMKLLRFLAESDATIAEKVAALDTALNFLEERQDREMTPGPDNGG